jgi:D-alanyl-lipoteichoic acid acyltransferase DltB (MBOAT superfamily)
MVVAAGELVFLRELELALSRSDTVYHHPGLDPWATFCSQQQTQQIDRHQTGGKIGVVEVGGNRIGVVSTYVNISITMLLGGLWHGASWNFIIWGGIHGAYLAFERAFLLQNRFWNKPAMAPIRWFVTMHVVCFAWVFFRAPDLVSANLVLAKLLELDGVQFDLAWSSMLATVLLCFLTMHLLGGTFDLKKRIGYGPLWLHVATSSLAILALIWFAPVHTTPFIYFQF